MTYSFGLNLNFWFCYVPIELRLNVYPLKFQPNKYLVLERDEFHVENSNKILNNY